MRRGLIGQYFTFAGLRITSRVMPTSRWGIPASNPLSSPSLIGYCSGTLVIPDPTECAVFDNQILCQMSSDALGVLGRLLFAEHLIKGVSCLK